MWRRAGVVAVVVVSGAAAGACSSAESGPSWVDQARVDGGEQGADVDIDLPGTVGCEPLGVDEPQFAAAPAGAAPSGEVNRGVGNDPYTATGARQLPGPDMERLAPPASPMSVVVARPVDPDEHVAARQADAVDTGPVPPSRYTPGQGSSSSADEPTAPRPGSTSDDDDSDNDDDQPAGSGGSSPCIPVLGP